ncbi:hypothetical protein T492DRAFT_839926 [Pavlovales sp. CCMP2436]|nr:hypothetical protein T492DRAFT_839926 [Pavlovales sp. CCMP2436]
MALGRLRSAWTGYTAAGTDAGAEDADTDSPKPCHRARHAWLCVLTLVALLGWQHAACAARARARVSGGDVPSSSVIFAGGGLGALALESIDNAEFYHRSVVVPGDSLRLGSTVARARLRGNMTIALVGGSTSAGGGHSSCPMSIECGLACCGEGYPDLIVRWLRESQSIAATLYNRAIGATDIYESLA